MNFKTTYVLFAVLAVILVVFGVALYRYNPDAGSATAYVLPSVHDPAAPVKEDQVDRVEVERTSPAEKIAFERDADGKRWSITQPRAYRADAGAVDGLIRQVFNARKDEKADAPARLADWGLGDPPSTGTVTLHVAGGRDLRLRVGDVNKGGGRTAVVYVTSSDLPDKGMAVAKGDLDDVLKPLNDFRARDLLSPAQSDIRRVKLSEGKKKPVELKKADAGRWSFVQPPYGAAEVEGAAAAPGGPGGAVTGVNGLLADVANLRVEDAAKDFVKDDATDLAKYHLDPGKDEILRVEIDRAADDKDKPTTVALLIGVSKAEDGKYYARREDEKDVVRVGAKEVDGVRGVLDKPEGLRDKDLVRFENFATPDALDVKNNTGLLEFRREDSARPWQLYRGDATVPTDDKAVQGLVSLLTQKGLVRAFPSAKPADLGLDKPSVTVSLWVDGVAKDDKKEEKKDDKKEGDKKDDKKEEKKGGKPKLKTDKPTVRLAFGNVENKMAAVLREVGDDKAVLQVPDFVLDRLREGTIAYTSKELPRFAEGFDPAQGVTRLTLTRAGATTELTHDPKAAAGASPWKFAAPPELAGRAADAATVTDILRALNNLQATKLVAEKAAPEVLDADYGLKSPPTKAVITVAKDGKDQRFEYDFGKDAPENTGVYAKLGERDLVFVADKAVLTTLARDLPDPTVFRFDPAKVKSVKVAGWQDLVGELRTLEFERGKDGGWAVKSPPSPAGFKVDAARVSKLLADLSALRAEKFVTRKATPKDREDNGLTAPKGALTVEVTVEGEKEPFRLTVGNLDAEKTGYLASSNRTGDDLFKIRKEPFEGAKAKPTFFSQ